MKRFIILFLVTLFSLSPVSAEVNNSNPECLDIKINLHQGVRGTSLKDEVLSLQKFLFSKGYLKVNPTGFFGLQTLNSVKLFQKDNNIVSTGYVGPMTRAFIQKTTCTPVVVETPPQVEVPIVVPIPEITNPPVVPVIDEILTSGNLSSLRIKTIGIISVTSNSLLVQGEVTAGARSGTTRWFEITTNPLVYKTSETIVSEKLPQRSNDRFNASFTGLKSGTTYYYRACAENTSLGQKTCGNTTSMSTSL
jgi:peptidoglycan hydrolase-like protein with peptidoglycan-binding domain